MKRHYYERNIIEIKNEYTQFLLNILVPALYDGIKALYYHSLNTEKKLKETVNNQSFNNPGILKIFQMYLKDIECLNSTEIEKETERIRTNSKCSDWFDDLVKSVIKSYIVLLTYNVSEKTCKLVDDKYHEKININEFIHKCYIECARSFYNNPEFVWHEYSKTSHMCDIRKSRIEINEVIKTSIIEAIRRMLPMKLILSEYLSNDYINDNYDNYPPEKFEQIKEMVKQSTNNANQHIIGGFNDSDNIKDKDLQKEKINIHENINKLSHENINKINHINNIIEKPISIRHESIKERSISTDDELDNININLLKLKENCSSDTSELTFNINEKKIKMPSESLLNIDIEHPIITKQVNKNI